MNEVLSFKDRLIPSRQARAALLSMLLASALCASMIAARALYTKQFVFIPFLWNLFLAWIPLAAALPLYSLKSRGRSHPVIAAILGVVWFLFFPNAPYIVTDLVHLYERPPVPYWFDILTIMSFAVTGLFIGYLSLYLMQELVRSRTGRWTGWFFAFGMLGLSAFGIYLGRFLRWNSWDIFVTPLETLSDAARMVLPPTNPQLLGFSATFFAFSLVCYLIVYSFTHLHAWVERNPARNPTPSGPQK